MALLYHFCTYMSIDGALFPATLLYFHNYPTTENVFVFVILVQIDYFLSTILIHS